MNEQRFNVKFVQEVEKHPCVYNYELPEYSRKDITEKNWNEIGEIMKMTGIACKYKWKNLRTVFMRHMKVQPNDTKKKKKPYYLLDVMQFLLPYTKAVFSEYRNSSLVDETEINPTASHEEVKLKIEPNDSSQIEYVEISNDMEGVASDTSYDTTFGNIDTLTTYPNRTLQEKDNHFMDSPSTINNEDNPTKCFMLSLLPELNEMNSTQLKTFKRRVFVLIDDIMSQTTNEET